MFGSVVNGHSLVSEFGEIVLQGWYDLPNHYASLSLDTFVVMPNHVHGLVVFANADDDSDTAVGASRFHRDDPAATLSTTHLLVGEMLYGAVVPAPHP